MPGRDHRTIAPEQQLRVFGNKDLEAALKHSDASILPCTHAKALSHREVKTAFESAARYPTARLRKKGEDDLELGRRSTGLACFF